MSANIETGHFINVSNFEDLISYCSAYGTSYNPAQVSIKLSALQQLQLNAKYTITGLAAKQSAYKNAISARTLLFEPLKTFSTRILNAYIACGAGNQNVKHVKFYVNKIRGIRKGKITTVADANLNTTASTEAVTHSSMQQSFDNMVEHYTNLIALLSDEPLYLPNEDELCINGLQNLLGDMQAKNTAVINTLTALNTARMNRNVLLYDQEDGLVDKAFDVKKYIKSVFGATSAEYKKINAIRFKAFIK